MQISYKEAAKVYDEWLALQPKSATPQELFAELYSRYIANPHITEKVIKKRHTPYNLNGKYFDTFNEFQEARNA